MFYARRYAATPGPDAARADLVLVSHLHQDHLHRRSLARFDRDIPIVVPRGGEVLLRRIGGDRVVPAAPGDRLDLDGVRVDVLAATHDHRRRGPSRVTARPLGFRVSSPGGSWWYPGDTELRDDMAQVPAVDLALVPVGGWGPTLGAGHMDPLDAAEAVRRVGARWAVPVHWGTFWPVGLARVARANHDRLFISPGRRFAEALAGSGIEAVVLAPGERFVTG